MAALDVELSGEEIAAIEAPYRPKAPTAMAMGLPGMDQVTVKGAT